MMMSLLEFTVLLSVDYIAMHMKSTVREGE